MAKYGSKKQGVLKNYHSPTTNPPIPSSLAIEQLITFHLPTSELSNSQQTFE